MPNIRMPDGVVVSFPDDMPKEQIKELVSSKFPEMFEPKGNEFTRGVQRGTETTAALITEGVPGIAKGVINDTLNFFGFDDIAEPLTNLQNYQEKVQKAYEKYPTKTPTFRDVDNISEGLGYVGAKLGERVPQIGLSLLSGGVGGAVAKTAVQHLAQRGGVALTKSQVNKAVAKGILGGTLASSASQNMPESYFNLLEKGEDAATEAVLIGGLKAALDSVLPSTVLGKILGTKTASDVVTGSLLKIIGKEAGKGFVTEGITESAQEGLDILGEQFLLENQEIFSKENVDRLIESGLAGAIGGGFVGAGAAPFINRQNEQFDYDKLTPKQKAKLDAAFTEETIGEAANTTVDEEVAANPLDDSVLSSSYFTDEVKTTAKEFGIQEESLTNISQHDLEITNEVVSELDKEELKNLQELYGNKNFTNKELAALLAARLISLKENKRTDNTFVPGDGEIVVNSDINPGTVINNPQANLKVNDTNKLENTTSARRARRGTGKVKPVQQTAKKDPFKLPRDYRNIKPRYGVRGSSFKINFPSDVEKAIYIVGNRSTKSKADSPIKSWLNKEIGLSDKEIVDYHKQIKDELKNASQNAENGATLNARKIDMGQYGTEKFQKMSLPSHGNLRDDMIIPSILSNNLKAVNLTNEAFDKFTPIILQVDRIIREVVGNKVNLAPFSKLIDSLDNNPVAGFQLMNVIGVAFNETTLGRVEETAYHEAYHALESMGAFSQKEIEIIDNATPTLLKYMNEDGFLRGQDFQVLLASPEGREELRANAFGKWAKEQKNVIDNKTLPSKFKNWFRKAKNIFTKFGNALKGLGFNSIDDIFNSAYEGGRSSDLIDNMNHEYRLARLQKIGEAFQNEHISEIHSEETFKNLMKEGVELQNQKWDSNKRMRFYGRFVRSMSDSAQQNPVLAPIYAAFERRNKNSSFLMSKYADILGDFTNLDNGVRHRLHDLGAYMRKTGQKAELDPLGRLAFERDGKIVRINDTEVSRQYMQMQTAYKEVLNDRFDLIKREAFEEFGKDILNTPDFGIEDVRAALAFAGDPTTIERLTNLLEALKGFEKMKNIDYVPAMRFGDWGITVRDNDTGKQVAFFGIEEGDFRSKFNKYQLEQTLKSLKEKYSDTKRYDIIGDKGKITNLSSIDNIQPFVLNRNAYLNKIDSRFLNFELLGSLLNEKNLNEEAYGEIKQKIYNDILNKGFKKHFLEAEFLDGYSNDWNRVQHAYLSSAAHHLADLPFQKELAVIDKELDKVKDKKVRDRGKSFIEYNNSPTEDLIALRTFNFLWTMGGNLSTAALQIMTLPTTTLGGMTQFNTNPISNMSRIGKWFSVAVQLAPAGIYNSEEGIAHLDFGNRSRWEPLIKKGVVSQEMVDLFVKLDKEGKIRGLLTEESIGSRQFETRSLSGKLRAGSRTFANYAGLPVTVMEQLTRFATTASMYDLLMNDPKALRRARKIYGDNYLFQAKMRLEPGKSFVEHAAEFAMDEAHAVFGKLGRPEFMKSYGGALFFPFMTYPQQAIEFIIRMLGRGPEGRKGAYMTLSTLFLFAGLTGLPGGELLKELLEELEKQVTGTEEDFDYSIRKKVYENTGDSRFAKFITQGIGRAYGGLDVSRRIGLPIPGQELLLNVLGIRGQPSDVLGVSGSLITSMGDAWNEYNNGSSTTKILSTMLPVAPANLMKAVNYAEEGVKTRRGLQLVTPEEITAKTIAGRAFGVTSDQVATKREEQYLSQLLEKRHTTAIERYRNQAKNIATEMGRARKRQDFDKVKDLQKDLKNVIIEVGDFSKRERIPFDTKSFLRSVNDSARQRLDTTIRPKDVRKAARRELPELQNIIGTAEE